MQTGPSVRPLRNHAQAMLLVLAVAVPMSALLSAYRTHRPRPSLNMPTVCFADSASLCGGASRPTPTRPNPNRDKEAGSGTATCGSPLIRKAASANATLCHAWPPLRRSAKPVSPVLLMNHGKYESAACTVAPSQYLVFAWRARRAFA